MTSTGPDLQTASLYFHEGPSDKVYHATIKPQDEGFIVTFAYGRRGCTLNTGTKTSAPVTIKEATKVFDKLVASKLAKGYQYSAASAGGAEPYHQSGNEGIDGGVRCQLLNPIEESDVARLLTDNRHCLQEKHDGRRLMVRKRDHEITGINRRGLTVAIPEPIRQAVANLPLDILIDGEAVGDTLHIFDLLEVGGRDLRQRGYLYRYSSLLLMLGADNSKFGIGPPIQCAGAPALSLVHTAVSPTDKAAMYEECRVTNREGVVFKDRDAPFSPGRPNSGGPQLKFKFVESASFVVTGVNAKRSVTLGLYDGDRLVPAGNVTIPPNHAIPQKGTVAEVKYLYAYKQSGAIYQPVYLGPRTDIPPSECGVDQLKYKSETEAEATAA
jgi:bifunctional non-homologous end joining protein LigD